MPLVSEDSNLSRGSGVRRNMGGTGTSAPSSDATGNTTRVDRTYNVREESNFMGGSGIRRNMAGKGVVSSIVDRTPTIPTTGGRGFDIPELGLGSGTPAVTNIQAQLNRSSRLIDIGGNPIGQLSVSPINIDTSTPSIPYNINPPSYTLTREGKLVPTIAKESGVTVPFVASRLLDLHTEDGFLDSYYTQLTGNGSLGIRSTTPTAKKVIGFSNVIKPKLKTLNSLGRGINQVMKHLGVKTDFNTDTNLSFNVPPDKPQPFIIRGIGKRWGIDRVEKPGNALGHIGGLVQVDRASHKGKDLVDSYFNLIDDVGRGIIGRTPSVFLDRYFADVKRINGATNALSFLTRGSTFINAQDRLQKRNRFEYVSSTLYKISDEHQYKITVDTFVPNKIAGVPLKGNIKGLDQGAVFNLNPRAYNPLSLFSVPGVLPINRNSYLDIGSIVAKGTMADFITDKVINAVAVAGAEYIKNKGKEYAKKWYKEGGKDWLKSKNLTAKSVLDSTEKVIDEGKKVADYVQKTAKYFETIPTVGPISKAALNQSNVNLSGYENIGQDKVNLIPYGVDYYTKDGKGGSAREELEDLDWIPFKFKDVRKNKSIVFRAILSNITDTFSPEYSPERYVGRPDSVYVYQGTNREISFTFDVYPKSMEELPILWEKLNYLAGLTYPHWTDANSTGARGMIAPYSELTIGQMYTDSPGYVSALTYTVMEQSTWETLTMKLPKYIQVSCTFVYIGNRLPSAEQKHYELPWVAEKRYPTPTNVDETISAGLKSAFGSIGNIGKLPAPGSNKPIEVDITKGIEQPEFASNFGKSDSYTGFGKGGASQAGSSNFILPGK